MNLLAQPVLLSACLVMLIACSKSPQVAAPSTSAPASAAVISAPRDHAGIAWKQAINDADVDAAFATARADGKPVFVYWGAKWCPPCNHVKATLFNRQDFIERSRAFVPIYVDGDSPGAQKLGKRFNVSGYPTMVLFAPDGGELTRLPGEVDPAQYTEVLTLGMNARRSVGDVLAAARAGGERARALQPADWRLLAFYAWDVDEQQLLGKNSLAGTLRQLAQACPAAEPGAANRLMLKAIASTEEAAHVAPDAQGRARVLQLFADPTAARALMDVLTNDAEDITKATSAAGTPERTAFTQAYVKALQRLEADATLSRADRMTALLARVQLARMDGGRVSPELLNDVRTLTARFDKEITDGYERQAVVTTSAYTLTQAGAIDESDALLNANLAKSHSPYYLMSSLASNAKKRGDKTAAVDWSRQAFEKSEGPATRQQWGASYIKMLIELTPSDEPAIEQVAAALFDEAGSQPNAFYHRSGRSLLKVSELVLAWNADARHAGVVARLRTRVAGVCAKLAAGDEQRAICDRVLKQPSAAAKLRGRSA